LCVTVLRSVNAAMAAQLPIRPTLLCWMTALRWPLAAAHLPTTPYPAPCVPPDWAAAALCQGVCAAGVALEAGAPVLDTFNRRKVHTQRGADHLAWPLQRSVKAAMAVALPIIRWPLSLLDASSALTAGSCASAAGAATSAMRLARCGPPGCVVIMLSCFVVERGRQAYTMLQRGFPLPTPCSPPPPLRPLATWLGEAKAQRASAVKTAFPFVVRALHGTPRNSY
jgi:hypothetical protein